MADIGAEINRLSLKNYVALAMKVILLFTDRVEFSREKKVLSQKM